MFFLYLWIISLLVQFHKIQSESKPDLEFQSHLKRVGKLQLRSEFSVDTQSDYRLETDTEQSPKCLLKPDSGNS